MQLSQDQLIEIQYSMLSEPGDAVAGFLKFELGAKQAITEVLSGNAERDWQKLLVARGFQEYLHEIPKTIERFKLRLKHIDPEQEISQQEKLGGEILFPEMAPWLFESFSDLGLHAPNLLWAKGNLTALKFPAISIVGSRQATPFGKANTSKLVALTPGFTIVSGGALGIDTAAHQAALALKNPTIAYMAGGLARTYPIQNQDLFTEITKNGLLLSELSPNQAPTKWRFLQRNRLIAAHGQLTVVVEAALRSGAINTAGHAFGCGRQVLAFPGPQDKPLAQGCNRLIRDGVARPIERPQDIAAFLAPSSRNADARYSPELTRALDSLSHSPRSVERLMLDSGLARTDLLRVLQQLQQFRMAFKTPRGWMLG